MGDRRANQAGHAEHVHVEYLRPLGIVIVLDGSLRSDTGVGDDHVETPEVSDHIVDRSSDRFGFRNVADNPMQRRRQRVDNKIKTGDRGPEFGESKRPMVNASAAPSSPSSVLRRT